MPDHPHAEIAKRLKRANGHLQTIIEMIEEERTCAEIAQQLAAVEGAIGNAKKALIRDHIGHGLKAAGVKTRTLLKDFAVVAKYL